MKIEDFWNQAFLAALCRLSPAEAKADADLSTQMCIEHWESARNHRVCPKVDLWKDQDIEGPNSRSQHLVKPRLDHGTD